MKQLSPTNCLFAVEDFEAVKKKVLNWTQQFSTFCFLDNHLYRTGPGSVECLLAAGVHRSIRVDTGKALEQLQEFRSQHNSWLFGHLSYDLKNELEALHSKHPDRIGFPDLFFFEPEIIIRLSETEMNITAGDPQLVFEAISSSEISSLHVNDSFTIHNRFTREAYLQTIDNLKKHILRGDCYEINFCQEFYADNVSIDPMDVYQRLSELSPNPFSALYRMEDQWLLCASPERFLRKKGTHILSQPIKGTSKRVNDDVAADEKSREFLQQSTKDRSENVMVVDLVRNDLARVCKEGTVKVDELFGIYTFPQVYQMISTVSGELRDDVGFEEIIRATFPMGSMTGAPKKRVMELIEQYEHTKRGLFSGAVGYITPDEDFDFNVVIRSIQYNAINRYVSFLTGSGITFYSDPEQEWDECMIKAAAMKSILEEANGLLLQQ